MRVPRYGSKHPLIHHNMPEVLLDFFNSLGFRGVLLACAERERLDVSEQAQHPPYDLPEEFAERAQNVFNEMVSKGIEPNIVHFHSLMDCQASFRRHLY